MEYVLITHDKLKFICSENEYKAVLNAIRNSEKFVVLQQSVVPLQITPTIVSFERWFAQENERLKLTNNRLCNLCFCIMNIYDKCACWAEQGKGKEQDGFLLENLPKSVIAKLHGTIKSFPKLTGLEQNMLKEGIDPN